MMASLFQSPSIAIQCELLALFGSNRFDRLVHNGVIETYKRELTPCCRSSF
jgi:hypothetical protein